MSPRRDTAGGRAYLDLQALARRQGRPTQELLVTYVLERFLYRLSVSPHRRQLVLKGGMLLAALESRRPTADVDLLATRVSGTVDAISALVKSVVDLPADDGVEYMTDRLTAEVIRDAELHSGVRIAIPARIDRANATLRLDVNIGDPVTPGPVEIEYPALLASSFRLMGYPLVTVLAEKLVTMVDRGEATTRERDFADVLLLTRHHGIDASELRAAVAATAAFRESELHPLMKRLSRLGDARQAEWTALLARSGLGDRLPASYAEAIEGVASFADPVLADEVEVGSWDPGHLRWSE